MDPDTKVPLGLQTSGVVPLQLVSPGVHAAPHLPPTIGPACQVASEPQLRGVIPSQPESPIEHCAPQ
jgi:hypothetical protein